MYFELKENKPHGTKDDPFSTYHIKNEGRSFQIPVHWHDELEIIYVKSGFLTVSISGENYIGTPGDAFVVSPGNLHFMGSQTDTVDYFTFLFPLKYISFCIKIIDDSLFNRTSCKKTELGSKVFDHTDMHFKKGFRMLTLSWSDGNTLIPVNSCLLASAKDTNIIGPVKDFDHRTLAGKRRKLAQTKAPEAMMTLLDTALSAGLNADYVLFDSWFSNPAQVTAIHSKGMDVIAMIKKSSRIKYSYCGEQLNIKEIYSRNKKRRGRSKYLLSVDVMVGKENPIPAKIVCVRNRANRKDWLAFICTDTTLSEEEIIRIYGKRWQIEVFFKTCKSMLNLIGECHSLSYDALTAHVAIVFTRYMLLAMEQRQNEDQRTLGELFFFLVDEMADITFNRSLGILMDALMASLQEILKLSDEQLTAFATDFEARLPEYLRNALHFKAVAA